MDIDDEIGFFKVNVDEAKKLILDNEGSKDFMVLDVRTPEEFEEGHIKDGVNLDFYFPEFMKEARLLDRKKKYLIYCRTDNRSGEVFELMRRWGFESVYLIEGGILDWMEGGGELE